MRGELVALDLETTGLDPANDSIIEFGAVRLKNGEIVDELAILIDPGFSIPTETTLITGIRTEDVRGKPSIASVLSQIQSFVGQSPVIGHNVEFDMGFLRQQGLFKSHATIDTYDLASVLLPQAPRYNLNSLTTEANIELEHAHRALDDARATALLYWHLWQKALELPYSTLYEISRAAQAVNWETGHVFTAALEEVSANTTERTLPNLDSTDLFTLPGDTPTVEKINRTETTFHIEVLLDENEKLSQTLANYEQRPQQREMMLAVNNALQHGQHLMVEAGTGTGKSIAYLIPAISTTLQQQTRVVISTNTINLQEQLIFKDIPQLKQALGIDFNATIMKGRGNYLCPRRLSVHRRRQQTSIHDARMLAKILVWLLHSKTGDKGEISLRGPAEHATWQRLSAEDEGCTTNRCLQLMNGTCPFHRARTAAEASQILIVNHALLISDAASENRVLPDYRYLIVDEAHQLEDAITNGLGFRIDQETLLRRIDALGTPNRGLLGDVLGSLRDHVPDKQVARMEVFVQNVGQATGVMRLHITTLFNSLYALITDLQGNNPYAQPHFRIVEQQRNQPRFDEIRSAYDTLDEYLDAVTDALFHLAEGVRRLSQSDIPGFDDLVSNLASVARYFDNIRTHLSAFATKPDANTIYWLNNGVSATDISLQTAPLHVGTLMEQYIWQTKEAVILTSATMRTGDTFDYIRERLYAENVETLDVGSPFNYSEAALVYVPDDIPDPTDRQGHQNAVERSVIELAAALNGRVMALFTSYGQLRQTAQAVTPRLALGDITVYTQSDGSSRQALLEGFKSSEKAVLLGTRSFWEGVDIPGDSLSAIIIARLPFTVPSDPIFAARSETYANAFNDFAVPDAILRFRQGFGRLIRTKTDKGIVAILDNRVITKGYGAQFLESLPNCTIQYGTLNQLPQVALSWLNASTSTIQDTR